MRTRVLSMCIIIAFLSGLLLAGRVEPVHQFLDRSLDGDQTAAAEVRDLVKNNFYRVPSIAGAENGAVEGYVAGLGDPFSAYLPPKDYRSFAADTQGVFSGIGVVLKGNQVTRVLSDTPARRSGLRAGDFLRTVNGTPTRGKSDAALSDLIKGALGTSVRIESERAGVRTTRNITRANIEQPTVTNRRFGTVLYVHISQFSAQTDRQLQVLLVKNKPQHLVLDLRGNGGGLVDQAVSISRLFLRKGDPVMFSVGRKRAPQSWYALRDGAYRDVPVSLVIDRNTASASEILASALSEQHGARIIGEKSYGKGVVEELFPLDNGGALKLTIAEYTTSLHKHVHRVGLQPVNRLTARELQTEFPSKVIRFAERSRVSS
jgi:carboxyl-terminal processing protease